MPSSPLNSEVPDCRYQKQEPDTSIISFKEPSEAPNDFPEFPGLSQFYTSSVGVSRVNQPSTSYLDKLKEATNIGKNSWPPDSRYEIIDAIAVGGMGAILRARERSSKRDVAMKVMLSADKDSPSAIRFKREAHIVANLEHPNIVPVHDIGFSPKNELYFTMKWVQGENLADILFKLGKGDPQYRNKYNLPTLLEIFIKICNGVAFAHSKNIVHLDLKPHNILVGEYGDVLVLDWGLATRITEEMNTGSDSHEGKSSQNAHKSNRALSFPMHHSIFTEDGTIKGTPGFMAPEQASGKLDEIDERSDVFSLGSILYMMLTLKFPIVGEHPTEIIRHTILGNFVPPGKRIYHKTVPKELEAIVMKAMALERANRFGSAKDLRSDIIAYSRGYATSVEQAGFFKRISLLLRRRRKEFTLLAFSVLALLCVIITFMIGLDFQMKETHQEKEIGDSLHQMALAKIAKDIGKRDQTKETEVEANNARMLRMLADSNSYVANIRLSDLSMQHSRYNIAANALKKCPPAFRHWEWGRLKYLTELDDRTLFHPNSFTAVFANRNGTTVAFADTDNALIIRNVITEDSFNLNREKDYPIYSIAMDNDASKLIIGGLEETFELWDLDKNELIRLFLGHSEPISALDFSGDGKIIAAGSWSGVVVVWDAESGEELQSIAAHDGSVNTIALSFDGKILVSGGSDATVKLWDFDNGTQIAKLDGHIGPVTAVFLDSQNNRVITGSQDQTIRVWDMNNGEPIQILEPEIGEITSVAVSSDGESILAGGVDFLAGIWDYRSNTLKRTFRGHAGPIVSVAFIEGGEKVLTASNDQTIKTWLIEGNNEYRNLVGHQSDVFTVAVSPDNNFVATASLDQNIKIWTMEDGQEIQNLTGYTGNLNGVCFGHDNEDLIAISDESSVTIWKFKTARKRLILKGHEGPINAISVSHDDRKIITAGYDKTARIWNAVNGRQDLLLLGHESKIITAGISSNGSIAATAGDDQTVRIWDTETGEQLHKLPGLDQIVTALAISSDGSLVLAGTESGKVYIFNSQTGALVRSLKGHWEKINSICISNDNQRLFTGSLDATVKVWDLNTGFELTTLKAHNGAINAIAITSDNRQLITGGADAQVIIWDTKDWAIKKNKDMEGEK